MKTHNVVPGSKEWLDLRVSHRTASEAGIPLGLSGYCTRTELLDTKKTGVSSEVSYFTEKLYAKGHALEANATPIAEELIGDELFPKTGTKTISGISMLASFDGLTIFNDVIFEHKMMNQELRDSLSNGIIPDQYKPQLEQQMMVSEASKALFMASAEVEPGSPPDHLEVWYESEPKLRKQIIAGWKQFEKDLAVHEVRIIPEAPAVSTVEKLPALLIQINGDVEKSNLDNYKRIALQFISNINTNLKTDQDFADAEEIVKFCGKAEKELESTKTQALAQTVSIDEMFKTIDFIKEELRKTRLKLAKDIKAEKTKMKAEIISTAADEAIIHFYAINSELKRDYVYIEQPHFSFEGAIKGKRSLSSIHSAVDQELANIKINLNQLADRYRANIRYLHDHKDYEEYSFLFKDLQSHIHYPQETFSAFVDNRLIEHINREAKRKQEELERIQAEEKRKAEAKAQAEAIEKLKLEKENLRTEMTEAKAEADRIVEERNTRRSFISSEAAIAALSFNDKDVQAKPETFNAEPETFGGVDEFPEKLTTQESILDEAISWLVGFEVNSDTAITITEAVYNGNSPFMLKKD